MVVDDDPLILRLCSLILDKNSVDHVTWQDPQQCLAEEADEDITHILLDIRMPSINGVDLCHQLRKKYRGRPKFIALTAHVLKEERESILQEGFDAILSKPFREAELIELLKASPRKIKMPSPTPDLSALRQMTLNDESLFQSVLAQFVEETTEDIQTLRNMVESGDTPRVREVIHRLSGRLSQIGITNVGGRFSELESMIVAGKEAKELADEIRDMASRLEELITNLRLTTMEHLN